LNKGRDGEADRVPAEPRARRGRLARVRRVAWRLAPWIVTAAVLAFLLGRYSLVEIGRELARPGALLVLPILLLTTLVSLVALSGADLLVLPRALVAAGPDAAGLGQLDLARARAGTAMLIGLHHGVSAGGFGLWLARRTGSDLRTTLGALGYVSAMDLAGGCLAALLASSIGGPSVLSPASKVAIVAAAGIAGVVVAAGLFGRVILRSGAIGRWLRDPRLLAPWVRVPPGAFLGGVALRTLNVAIWIVGTWAATRAFGLPLSFAVMAANLPLVAVIAALPMSVGGLGAAQLAWVEAFETWTRGESILAFQFVLHISVTLAFVIRGLPFVRRVLREIEDGRRP
jgi:hypothetical protein